MPTVFVEGDYAFRFYSSDCARRPNVHVHREDAAVKIWLTPVVRMASTRGFSAKELAEIHVIIRRRHVLILDSWKQHFDEN